MGDTTNKALSSGSKKTYKTVTFATVEMESTPSWIWDQLETDGATLNSVLDKVDNLSKAQLMKYFPREDWGNLEDMSKEDRKKSIAERLNVLGFKSNWEGKGQYNPKPGQVDTSKFNPFDTVLKAGKERKDGSVDYTQGMKKLSSTLDKMSIDELKDVIKKRKWGSVSKNANHRTLKQLILNRVDVRVNQGQSFFGAT